MSDAFVRDGKYQVAVARKDCRERKCYILGFDKGTFVHGRGYTSYHKKERPVCMTRHLRGCPHGSICPKCRTMELDPPGAKCLWGDCDGISIAVT